MIKFTIVTLIFTKQHKDKGKYSNLNHIGQHTIRSNIQNLSGIIQKFHNESSHKYQGPKLKKLRHFYSPIFLFGCFSCFLFSLIASAELDCPEEDEEGWCGLALEALTGTTG